MAAAFTDVPSMFGPLHLTILGGILILCAGLFFLLRKKSEKALIRLLGILGAVMILAEIFKQWYVPQYVYPGAHSTWFFPWQLCDMAMYASFLIPFLKGRAQNAALVFLATFSLLSGLVALIVPGDMLRPQIVLFWVRFGYHALMMAESLIALLILKKRARQSFLPPLFIYLAAAAVAEVINVICYHLPDSFKPAANMFNITPFYPSTQPVFHEIALAIGILPEILIYLTVIAFGAFGLHLLETRILHGKRKKRIASGQRQE